MSTHGCQERPSDLLGLETEIEIREDNQTAQEWRQCAPRTPKGESISNRGHRPLSQGMKMSTVETTNGILTPGEGREDPLPKTNITIVALHHSFHWAFLVDFCWMLKYHFNHFCYISAAYTHFKIQTTVMVNESTCYINL